MADFDLSKYYGETEKPESPPTYDLNKYYSAEPEDEPSFMDDLSGALSSGYRNMKAGLAGTDVITGLTSPETAAPSFVDAIKNQPETPEYYKSFLAKVEAEGKDVTEAEGFWDTTIESVDLVGEVMLEAVTNPKGLAYTITESLAQSLPAVGLGGAGAIAGGFLGSAPGAVVGLSAGTVLGTFAVEAGGHLKGLVIDNLREQGRSLKDVTEADIVEVFENPEFMEWAESEATKRGLSVAAVEGLFAAFGGKILSGSVGKSAFSKVTRGAADVGVETIGEATGEFAGQLATEGDIDPGGIAMEAIAGLGQSTGTTLTGAAIRPVVKAVKPKDKLDSLFGAGVDDIEEDPLSKVMAGPGPVAEPTSFEQETSDALALISKYGDLTDAAAAYTQAGMFKEGIIGALYEDSLAVPHPQRTKGQKALVEMGRKAEESSKSPLDRLREQVEDEQVDIPTQTLTPEDAANIPEMLRGTADTLAEISDEQVTEATPAEAGAPVEEVRPITEGLEPVEQPGGDVVPTAEPIALTVSEIENQIDGLSKNQPKGVKATKVWQQEMSALGKMRDAAIKEEIDIAANQAATSETNALPEPNEEQAKAGDYKKGLLDLNGFGIAIENPKGSTRSGKDAQGKEWSTTMKDHYGEIQNTEGADGDNVDVFIGDNPESQKVFVVDQIDPATGKFDEHKVIMGTNDAKQAKRTYKRNYAKGWKGDGAITEMSVEEFKQWVNFGDTRKPLAFEEGKPDAKSIADRGRARDTAVTTEAVEEAKAVRDSIGGRAAAREDVAKPSANKLPIKTKRAVEAKVSEAAAPAAAPVEAKQPEPSIAKAAAAIDDTAVGAERRTKSNKLAQDNNIPIWETSDGATFYQLEDGRLVDSLNPDSVDLTYDNIAEAKEWLGDDISMEGDQLTKARAAKENVDVADFVKEEGPTEDQKIQRAKNIQARRASIKEVSKPAVDKKAEARRKVLQVDPTDSLLTTLAKLGGLDIEHWKAQGIDPADMKSSGYKKVFGRPAFKKDGTFRADDVIEYAEQNGFGVDLTESDVIDMINNELNGNNVYNSEGQAAAFELDSQTEAEAQADMARIAEIDRQNAADAAPSPDDFDLTGSPRMRDQAPAGQGDIFTAMSENDAAILDAAITAESDVVFEGGDLASAAAVITRELQAGKSLDQAIITASDEVSTSAAGRIGIRINKALNAETTEQAPTTTTERVEVPSEDKAAAPEELRGGEPEGVTAEELVPEPSTLSEVVKKDVTTILNFIKARTDVPAMRAVIERIIENIPVGLKIQTLKVGDIDPSKRGMQGARGLFQPETNTIFLKDESFTENGMSEETIIHEVLHAVTADLLKTGNMVANKGSDLFNATQELYTMQNRIVAEVNRRLADGWKPQTNLANIALENVDELISWGLTNPEFQDLLMSMPADKGSVWNKFVSAISRMLGISEENQNTLSQLMVATDKLISADYRVDQAMRDQLAVVRDSSSYKVTAKSLPQTNEIELLQDQVNALQYDVETKSDITAGKKLKEANSRLEFLQEEIQEQRATDPYFEQGTDDIDAQGDALMGKPASRMTLRERLRSFFDNLKVMGGNIPYIMGRITSSAYVIEAQERKTHGSRLTAEDSMTAAVHKSWNSKVAASMAIHEHGVSMENGTIVPDQTKPGLSQILEKVANHGERYLRRFEQYLLLQRSKELIAQDRENFVTQENIDLMESWLDRNPNTKALFERQHKAFQTWNKGTLDVAIASGWINEQDAYGGYMAFDEEGNEVFNAGKTLFKTEADALEVGDTAAAVEGWYSDMYVPFYRIADDKGTKKPGTARRTAGDVAKAVKKLKGGEGQIPILENIVKNAEFIINGSMRTIAMQKIETEFRDTVMEEMDGVEVPGLIDAAEMREEYRNIQEEAALEGEPVPRMGQADAKRWAQMKSFARPTDTSTVVVYRNGRPKYYKVLDERLLTALKSIGAPRANNWLKIIGAPTRLLQKSITIMPAFLARSFTRELQNAFIINREGGANPLKTLGKGLKNFAKIATGDKAWMGEMMTGGFVNYNTYYNVTPEKLRNKLEKAGVKRSTFKNIVLSPWEGAKSLGRIYMQIAVASEHASRKTVYDDFIKAGASKEEAMYQALDTMNFSRRSDFAFMDLLLATIPFFNPRIQGLDRLYRGAKEDWKPFALKAGLMAASATALSLFNWEENEEEMRKLKDEDKAMNYHIFLDLGGTTKEHWRIPKGFEVGQITGTLPEFFVEQLYADQAEPTSKALRRFMTTTFGIQMPQFAAPAYDVATNEDSFRQRPIINYGQQFLLPNAQFDAWTSKLIVDIAQSMPDSAPDWLRSPKKLSYLVKGYTGSSGAMLLEGIDDIYRATGNAPDLPTKKASELYLVRDFYRTGSVTSSKQMDLFYEMVMETGKLASTLKAAKDTSREEYREIRVEHAAKLRARKALNKYSKRMSQMSSQMRKIMQNDIISSDEKERRKDALTKRKNALAQRAVDRYWYIFD